MKNELIELAKDLIEIKSTEGREKEIADFICKYLEGTEFKIEKQHVDNRYNIIATIGEPKLVLTGHIDTVSGTEKEWGRELVKPKILKNKLYGLGAADMKGGLAAMLIAAKKHQNKGLMLFFDVDEEYNFAGMNRFLKDYKKPFNPELVVFAEPTDLKIINAHRGLYEFHIEVEGKSAHAGCPQKGKDASRLYEALRELENKICSKQFQNKNSGEIPSLNIGNFVTGTYNEKEEFKINMSSVNKVPNYAKVKLDIRPTEKLFELGPDWIKNFLKNILNSYGLTMTSFEVRHSQGTLYVPKEDLKPLVKAIEKSEMKPEFASLTGFSEAKYLYDKFKVPVANFGPAPMDMSHKPNEYVDLDSLMKCVEVYEHLIEDVLE